jgi:hypothetical protein
VVAGFIRRLLLVRLSFVSRTRVLFHQGHSVLFRVRRINGALASIDFVWALVMPLNADTMEEY